MLLISALLSATEQQEETDVMDERCCSGISEFGTDVAAVCVWSTSMGDVEKNGGWDSPEVSLCSSSIFARKSPAE